MKAEYIPLISGFVGAIIGAGASVGTMIVASYFENKRQKIRLAYEAALEDHRVSCEAASKRADGGLVSPLTSYIHFHFKYMELLGKDKVTKEEMEKLSEERDMLWPEPNAND